MDLSSYLKIKCTQLISGQGCMSADNRRKLVLGKDDNVLSILMAWFSVINNIIRNRWCVEFCINTFKSWMDGWMEHLNTYSGVSIINIYFSVYAANAFLFFFFNITPHNMIHTWSESSESHLPHVYPFMFILSSATFIQGTAMSFHRDIMHAVCYWMRNTSGSRRAHLSRKV